MKMKKALILLVIFLLGIPSALFAQKNLGNSDFLSPKEAYLEERSDLFVAYLLEHKDAMSLEEAQAQFFVAYPEYAEVDKS